MTLLARLLRPMSEELDSLRANADRSDPLDEAVLCLVEAAVLALGAADSARSGADPAQVQHRLRDVLGAARASVTAATFAMVRAEDIARDSRPRPAVHAVPADRNPVLS